MVDGRDVRLYGNRRRIRFWVPGDAEIIIFNFLSDVIIQKIEK